MNVIYCYLGISLKLITPIKLNLIGVYLAGYFIISLMESFANKNSYLNITRIQIRILYINTLPFSLQ